jgi:NAD(P)H-flavin reductase
MSLADPARRLAVDRVEAVGAYTLLVLRNDGGDVGRPGQFFMLSAWPEPADAYLPRALSAAWADEREIAFLVDVRGAGTRALVDAASVEVRGPLGTGFAIADRPALLVGGGIGAAILPWLARELPQPPRALLGFRSEAHAVCAALVSDDPTVVLDPVLVTEPLARQLPFDGVVYACGPDPMLHAVAALCAEHDVECQVAMEAAMACGYGACYGCAVQIDGVWKRLCVEGPVLEAERILA